MEADNRKRNTRQKPEKPTRKTSNRKRKRGPPSSSTTLVQAVPPAPFQPRPFWNRDCGRWSRIAVPPADRLASEKVPITSCGSTWFTARRFYQQQEFLPPPDWRAILEPVLPDPPPPPDVIPVVKNRCQKKAAVQVDQSATTRSFSPTPKGSGKKRSPKPPAAKTKRLRIYPDTRHCKTLLKWMGVVRWTYNRAVAAIKENPVLEKNAKGLRNLFTTKKAIAEMGRQRPGQDFSWISDTPSFCRNAAISDAMDAYKSNRTKQRKQGKRFKFDIKFRSRQVDPQQCITFSSEDWERSRGMCADLLSRGALRCCQPLPQKMRYDFDIIYVRATAKFFLCLPEPLEPQCHLPCDPDREPYHVVALDPGVRTFQTGFDEEGTAIEFGTKRDNRRIFNLCQHLDALESRRNAKKSSDSKQFLRPHKIRANMKRAAARMRERIRNLVDELHRKVALWLCWNYDAVLIPEFQTARMAKRSEERCIGNRTARMMYTWAHYRFRQRLQDKAREYPRCRVVLVREDYTSKTCGRCGAINRKLKGAEVYRCTVPTCGYVAGRDRSAARNIMLRYITEHPSPAGMEHLKQQQRQQTPLSCEGGTFGPCPPRSLQITSKWIV